MGTKERILILIVFFCCCSPAFLFPLARTMSSVHLQENDTGNEGADEHSSSTNGGENGIAHRSNFAPGVGGRGGEGGTGQEGNGGGSSSQYTPRGTGVIPIYAAGAANGHHNNHHSAGSCNRSCVGLPTLGAVILASLIVHIYAVFGLERT